MSTIVPAVVYVLVEKGGSGKYWNDEIGWIDNIVHATFYDQPPAVRSLDNWRVVKIHITITIED